MRLISPLKPGLAVGKLATLYFNRGWQRFVSASSGLKMSPVNLRVEPESKCLFDRPVTVKVDGLAPRQLVTLRATLTDEKGDIFSSSARYQSDGKGRLDLSASPALGGDYSGVQPMGFLWALKPQNPFRRLMKRDVTRPCKVHIEVRSGGEEVGKDNPGPLLASCAHERVFIGQGVRRVPVKEGRIRATLFLPPGKGPFPGLVDLGGTAGGLLEYRSSLLAGHGFAAMALAYFGFEDLPERMSEFHLEYFEEALRYLQALPQVREGGVGVLGISKGADLALSMASFLPGVSAVVSVAGCNANFMTPLQCGGSTLLPGLGMCLERVRVDEALGGVLDFSDCYEDPRDPSLQGCVVPIERASARFLFLVGEDDQNWPSTLYAMEAAQRLGAHGRAPPEVVIFPGAGHLLEPPYFPHCRASFHKLVGAPLLWGGQPQPHAAAQEQAWSRVLSFLKESLPGEAARSRL
ncbi:ACOT2 thioesterase, partial [Polyodon spathula]|nr:acyl-coenzyme A thioesterase 1-like [Polyodon spathula]MBN3285339.1 ACOT2 thioesterase [Polyodon spathula]